MGSEMCIRDRPNFAVRIASSNDVQMKNHQTKCISIKDVVEKEHKANNAETWRLNLETVAVIMSSTVSSDKNGKPYRTTRVVNAVGTAVPVMVWGDLSEKNELWEMHAFVDIAAVSANFEDKRLDVRPFSDVKLANEAKHFRIPAKCSFLQWP